ncbi:hypothetical protein SAMD00019534_005320 [Acytostelium subglobosum LB1]|uniref:hypothetical protein n=1 Tax=Acytostelium subglobosum LB1 TaxID=1410327 RepID=UPI000644B08D|nr:hypothetical protein SAMD00019534_005320 [Acytostelium subglobosum LB1]GAM17357.1 hypothetical protein SAMD00019534_005320 [Acytostelium subglobosum LB1]|eukprot:XP_012759419.1 hypothetical protein SAMD00019534_005320 [Acytostelium subglobosum LB1]
MDAIEEQLEELTEETEAINQLAAEASPFDNMTEDQLQDHFSNTFTINSKVDWSIVGQEITKPHYHQYNVMNSVLKWITSMNCLEVPIYNVFLAYFKRYMHSNDFAQLLKYMRKANLEMNVDTFNLAIGMNISLGRTREVYQLYREMNQTGVAANIDTYFDLIRCYSKTLTTVNQLIGDMQSKGIARNEKINALLIGIFLSHEDTFQTAFSHYDEIVRDLGTPSALTYNSLFVGLANSGRFDLLRQFWRQMNQLGVTPYEETVSRIIEIYSDKRDLKAAIDFYLYAVRDYTSFKKSPKILGALLRVLIVGKRFDQLSNMLDYLENNNIYTLEMYNIALNLFSKFRNPQVCQRLYENLLKSGMTPNAATYSPLVHMAIYSGNVADCHHWMEKMRTNGILPQVEVFSNVLRFYLTHGAVEHVKVLINEIINNNLLTASSYASILVFNQMMNLQAGYYRHKLQSQDTRFREITYDQIIEIYLFFDNYERALEWFEQRLSMAKMQRGRTLTLSYPLLLFITYHTIRGETNIAQYWENMMVQHKVYPDNESRIKIHHHFKKFYSSGNRDNSGEQGSRKEKITMDRLIQLNRQKQQPQPDPAQAEKQREEEEQKKRERQERDEQSDDIDVKDYVVQKQKASSFKDIIKESPISFRMRMTTLVDRKLFKQAMQELDAMGGQRLPRGQHILELNFSLGTAKFQAFVDHMRQQPYVPSIFEGMYLSVMAKFNVVRCITEIMNHPGDATIYTNSSSIRNSLIYGLTHRGELELAQSVVRSIVLCNSSLSINSIQFFLKTYLERNEVPAIAEDLYRYYHSTSMRIPDNLVNIQILGLIKEGSYESALGLLREAQQKEMVNRHTIPLAMEIYANRFPMPPSINLTMWLSIKKMCIKNGISTAIFYTELFKCLKRANMDSIIIKYATQPNFFTSQQLETLKIALSCCHNDKEVIRIFKMANSSRLQMDNEVEAIVTEANKTVNDHNVLKCKFKTTLQAEPKPLPTEIKNFIKERMSLSVEDSDTSDLQLQA